MSERSRQIVEHIRLRLAQASRRIAVAEIVYGAILTFSVLASIWLLLAAIEAGFWISTTPRSLLFWALLVGGLVLIGLFLVFPLLRLLHVLPSSSDEQTARKIGDRFPDVSDRLLNFLQLAEGKSSEAPAPLVDAAVQMLGSEVENVPFEQVEDYGKVRKVAPFIGVPVLGLLAFVLIAPGSLWNASVRLASPGIIFERPAPYTFEVFPGDVEVVKGASLEISASSSGRITPVVASVEIKMSGERHIDEIHLTTDSTDVFSHRVSNVRSGFTYRFTSGAVSSPWHTVSVLERPSIQSLQLTLSPPGYTGLGTQRMDPNVGDITGYPGSSVRIDLSFAAPDLQEAYLLFDDSTTVNLEIDRSTASGRFTLSREGSYHVFLRNATGITNSDPITYSIGLMRDDPPAVTILSPEQDSVLGESMRQPVVGRMTDDFGFRKVSLFYRVIKSVGNNDNIFSEIPLQLDSPGELDQPIQYEWLIPETIQSELEPGDSVEYYLQAWDNNSVAGFQTGRSAIHSLRLPSLSEQYQDLEDAADDAEEDIQEMLDDSENLESLFEELREELRRKPNAEWEDQRQLERLQNSKEQFQERIESLSNQLEDINEMMQQNDLASPQTQSMFEELQKLAQELNTPEMLEALRKMQEAMQQMDPRMLEQSMNEFEFSEEQFQERMERLLELFKNLRMQQEMEEITNRLDELAETEEQLAEELEKIQDEQKNESGKEQDGQNPENQENQSGDDQQGDEQQQAGEENGEQTDQQNEDQESQENATENDSRQSDSPSQDQGSQQSSEQKTDELIRQQQQAKQEMEAIQQKLQEMQEQMSQMEDAPKQNMQQMMQDMQQQNMPQQMQQNMQQMQQQQLQDAQQGQQQMQQQLQQMSQQMQMMQQQMNQQQMQMNINALRRMLDDVLTLSQEQESLRDESRQLEADNPRLRRLAQQQVELSDGLRLVSDSLKVLSKNIPQMSSEVQIESARALGEMQRAVGNLTERQIPQSSGNQKASMTHLNELALLLSELMNQLQNAMQNPGSSMSMQQMMQQMQQMSGQQQQLNQQIQNMLNQTQGERLRPDSQARMEQMARMQEQLRQQLEQLNSNPEFRENALGDMKKVIDEMDETIQELMQNSIGRETVRRQQRILTRMLEAQKSLQERGREEKREGERAREKQQNSPSAQPPLDRANSLRRDLIRALESGYAPDYQNLIKRYFELLQQNNN